MIQVECCRGYPNALGVSKETQSLSVIEGRLEDKFDALVTWHIKQMHT